MMRFVSLFADIQAYNERAPVGYNYWFNFSI